MSSSRSKLSYDIDRDNPQPQPHFAALKIKYDLWAKEANCVTRYPTCAFHHRLLLNNLNVELLEQDLASTMFLDYTIYREIACLFDALIYDYTDHPRHDRLYALLTRPRALIGGVFLTGLKGSTNLLAIKTGSFGGVITLIREYIIGKFVVNHLREELPNFMYTYGFHQGSAYIISEGEVIGRSEGEVIGWNTTDSPDKSYLYLERVTGVSFEVFLEKHGGDSEALIEVMLQIFNALDVAFKRYSFRHNDLHVDNVIVRELTEPIDISFTIFGRQEYIRSRWIPQMIDFGLSSIVYKGEKIGPDRPQVKFAQDINHLFYRPDMLKRIKKGDTRFTKLEEFSRFIDKSEKEREDSFYDITVAFLEIMGGRELIRQRPLSQPRPLIGDTYRFYQRYFRDQPYSMIEYVDLVRMTKKYHLSEFGQWLQRRAPTSSSIVQDTKRIVAEVDALFRDNPNLLSHDKEITTTFQKEVEVAYLLSEYVSTLISYTRSTAPLAYELGLISARDKHYICQTANRMATKYTEFIAAIYRTFPMKIKYSRTIGVFSWRYAISVMMSWDSLHMTPLVEDM